MTLPLNVESRGTGGTPVLFVHSFAGDVSHWTAQLDHLKNTRRAVAFDLSGHGKSPGAVGPYSIRELAKDVADVADAQALEEFVLVGHSAGALIACEYAASHPRRVRGLGLIDAPPAPGAVPVEQVRQIQASLARDPYGTVEQFWNQAASQGSRPEVRDKLLAGLRRLARNTVIELTGSSLDYDATVPLRNFRGGKFAIHTPSNDAPFSLHNAVPGIQHTSIDGTGHWIQLDEPTQFNQVLDIFLRGL
jgi:pimeloyl-ACP methyl ester carboxylesterase